MHPDRNLFKHLAVKEFLDQYMPRAGKKNVFSTKKDLEDRVLKRLNFIHYGQAVITDPSMPQYLL